MDPSAEEQEPFPELFGFGRPGDPVPEVDPSDMKALWTFGDEVIKDYPETKVAIGVDILESLCKPGANIAAISYRTQMVRLFQRIFPEVMDPLIKDKLDAVIEAASDIPMEWVGRGFREGLPFNADEFVRRVRDAA
jgi:hypothetical protein